ncbi:tRNA-specific 2-thiouridylase, partial [Chytriomyces sp. MP71]
DLHAVFMHNWDHDGEMCPTSSQDFKDAQRTASSLQIPLHMVNFTKEYWIQVFEPMVSALEQGLTPNPDVRCNQTIKFVGTADFVATGHYAQLGFSTTDVSYPPASQLLRALDRKKDQSYFLSTVSGSALNRTLFPLGGLPKRRVKHIAHLNNLPHVAAKRESVGICFVNPDQRYRDFVDEFVAPRSGRFVSLTGEVKGLHDGVSKYTVGQRARIGGQTEKWFVSAKDMETGDVTVVPGSNHPALKQTSISIHNWTWISGTEPSLLFDSSELRASMKVRHQSEPLPGIFKKNLNCADGSISYRFDFDEAERGVAAGQHAALYLDEICLGGGTILI